MAADSVRSWVSRAWRWASVKVGLLTAAAAAGAATGAQGAEGLELAARRRSRTPGIVVGAVG